MASKNQQQHLKAVLKQAKERQSLLNLPLQLCFYTVAMNNRTILSVSIVEKIKIAYKRKTLDRFIKQIEGSSDFTYDLEAMKKAINSPKRKVPKSALESDESFDKWLND